MLDSGYLFDFNFHPSVVRYVRVNKMYNRSIYTKFLLIFNLETSLSSSTTTTRRKAHRYAINQLSFYAKIRMICHLQVSGAKIAPLPWVFHRWPDQPEVLRRWTLPETNSKFAPENRPRAPKRKGLFSNHPFFRCELLVSGRVTFLGIFVGDNMEGGRGE